MKTLISLCISMLLISLQVNCIDISSNIPVSNSDQLYSDINKSTINKINLMKNETNKKNECIYNNLIENEITFNKSFPAFRKKAFVYINKSKYKGFETDSLTFCEVITSGYCNTYTMYVYYNDTCIIYQLLCGNEKIMKTNDVNMPLYIKKAPKQSCLYNNIYIKTKKSGDVFDTTDVIFTSSKDLIVKALK